MSRKCCLIKSIVASAIAAVLFSSIFSVAHAQAAPELGKPFELKFGQQSTIASGVTISFLDVVEDSRCPSDVVCIQAGQATIGVSVSMNGTDERHNLTVGPRGNESATFGQYSVMLTKLDPYPVSTVQTAQEDYVATLTVSKARGSHPGTIAGQVASVQMGSDGKPEWIQSGIWVMRGFTNSSDMSGLSFISRMAMVMTDGTTPHSHSIYGFKSSGQKTEGNVVTINGTATVTMRNGPVEDVPLSIQISNMATAAIKIGPEKVDSHFGDDPVYGVVSNSSASMEG